MGIVSKLLDNYRSVEGRIQTKAVMQYDGQRHTLLQLDVGRRVPYAAWLPGEHPLEVGDRIKTQRTGNMDFFDVGSGLPQIWEWIDKYEVAYRD